MATITKYFEGTHYTNNDGNGDIWLVLKVWYTDPYDSGATTLAVNLEARIYTTVDISDSMNWLLIEGTTSVDGTSYLFHSEENGARPFDLNPKTNGTWDTQFAVNGYYAKVAGTLTKTMKVSQTQSTNLTIDAGFHDLNTVLGDSLSVEATIRIPATIVYDPPTSITAGTINFGSSTSTYTVNMSGGNNWTVTSVSIKLYDQKSGGNLVNTYNAGTFGYSNGVLSIGLTSGVKDAILYYWNVTKKDFTRVGIVITTNTDGNIDTWPEVSMGMSGTIQSYYTVSRLTATRGIYDAATDSSLSVTLTASVAPIAPANNPFAQLGLFPSTALTLKLINSDSGSTVVTGWTANNTPETGAFSYSDTTDLANTSSRTYYAELYVGTTATGKSFSTTVPEGDSLLNIRRKDDVYTYNRIGINNGNPVSTLDVKGHASTKVAICATNGRVGVKDPVTEQAEQWHYVDGYTNVAGPVIEDGGSRYMVDSNADGLCDGWTVNLSDVTPGGITTSRVYEDGVYWQQWSYTGTNTTDKYSRLRMSGTLTPVVLPPGTTHVRTVAKVKGTLSGAGATINVSCPTYNGSVWEYSGNKTFTITGTGTTYYSNYTSINGAQQFYPRVEVYHPANVAVSYTVKVTDFYIYAYYANATFENSWANFTDIGGYQWLRYTRDASNFTHIEGSISNTTAATDTTIFTLPAAYRPLNMNVFPAFVVQGSPAYSYYLGRINIDANGLVKFYRALPIGNSATPSVLSSPGTPTSFYSVHLGGISFYAL